MKRWLLPASALVLVVIACGVGVKPAPRVTEAGARVPSVRAIAAHRERAAAREAKRLLRAFVLPPRARRIAQPPNYAGVMRQYGPAPLSEVADAHHFWSVRMPRKAVVAFLRRHRLHGFKPSGATWGTRDPHYLVMSSRATDGTRYLNVTTVGLPTRTLLRVDVLVEWTYPRAPTEKVPSDTMVIVLHAPKVSTEVTDPVQVARIVRWFDALPVSPPGIAVMCPLGVPPDITLSFRNARGAWLAQAKLPPTLATICESIAVSIGGRDQKPLVDRAHSESFVHRLQQLVGVQLIRISR
jgi:hypothetical protein